MSVQSMNRGAASLFQRIFRPSMAWLSLACLVFTGCHDRPKSTGPKVRVHVAASLAHVIEGLADQAHSELGVRLIVNAAASGTLVQQITRGDRADLFISADPRWMDRLAEQGLIDQASRIDLAGNQLVLIGLSGSQAIPDALSALSEERFQPIAIGDPAYVPVGRYALQVLKAHGLNPGTQLQLAEAPDARAVLAFVFTGQCPVGLVYASDALKSSEGVPGETHGGTPGGTPGVEVLIEIKPADHDPIRYPAAVLTDAPNREQALRVLEWLKGESAQSSFREAGFVPAE